MEGAGTEGRAASVRELTARQIALVLGALAVAIGLLGCGAASDGSGPPGRPVPAGFGGSGVSFISANVGWVVGTAPCGRTVCPAVLRTRDGGRTWRQIPAPGGISDPMAIRFASATEGFAYEGDGPGLWITMDGGSHWRRARSGPGVGAVTTFSVATTSDGRVYALAATGESPNGHPLLLRSGPGHPRFTLVRRLPTASDAASSLITTGPDAYVTAGRALLEFSASAERTARLPAPGCALAAGATDLYAVCERARRGRGPRQAFSSTDGGRRWSRLVGPGQNPDGTITAVAATADGHIVVATENYPRSATLVTTVDGGRRWRTVFTRSGNENSGNDVFTDLTFQDSEDGTVIADPVYVLRGYGESPDAVLRTTDGGASWHAVRYR